MKTIKQSRFKKIIIISEVIACCAIVYILLSFSGFKIPCIFNKLTGLKCPGCGNTRAVKSLLQLNIKQAFSHNLLFPLEIGYIAWVYINACYNYLKTGIIKYITPHIILDASVLIIILMWGILRNILGC